MPFLVSTVYLSLIIVFLHVYLQINLKLKKSNSKESQFGRAVSLMEVHQGVLLMVIITLCGVENHVLTQVSYFCKYLDLNNC